jgi:ABC-type uncharacterized transport system involved in gliding motility auxiliary subunit
MSKIFFVVAGLSFLILAVVYFMVGAWLPIIYLFAFVMVVSLGLAIAANWKLYLEFFTLRTTKHGMNMGVLILLVLTSLICVNYLAVKYNKTFDLTAEHLHTLSEQSHNLISGLKQPLKIKIFYKGPAAIQEKQQIQKVVDLFKDASSQVHVEYFNSYTDQAEAQDYLAPLADKDSAKVFVFIELDGKRLRVEAPFEENQITGSLVKATRRGEKKIYFLKGHGERDLESDSPDGLKNFKEALLGQAFKIDTISLLEKSDIPPDADFLAIIGPKEAYLEPELGKIKEFAKKGGRLMIAADPGLHHNLAGLLHSFGVEFANDYVISLSRDGYSPMAVAVMFSPESKITQDFQSGAGNTYAVFDVASQLRVTPDIANNLKAIEIVKSTPMSLAVSDLKTGVTGSAVKSAHPLTLGIQVYGDYAADPRGKVTETNKPDPDKLFEVVVFGDSDFVSNQSIFLGINRDLALNTAADLAHETDLIGKRPKSFKGTVLELSRYQQIGVVMGGIGLPIFLLITSGIMWYRRRGA